MITYTTWDHFSFYVSLLHRLQIIPNRLHGIETFNRYNQIRLNDIKNAQRIMQHSHVNHSSSSTRYLHPVCKNERNTN